MGSLQGCMGNVRHALIYCTSFQFTVMITDYLICKQCHWKISPIVQNCVTSAFSYSDELDPIEFLSTDKKTTEMCSFEYVHLIWCDIKSNKHQILWYYNKKDFYSNNTVIELHSDLPVIVEVCYRQATAKVRPYLFSWDCHQWVKNQILLFCQDHWTLEIVSGSPRHHSVLGAMQ